MTDCVFCRLAGKSIEAEIVFEDDLVIAFLDSHPIRPGHAQVIPREHFATFEDLPEQTATRIMSVAQRVASALRRLSGVERVAFLFTGGDIPHAHAHVVPMHDKTDITSRRYIAEEHLTFRSTAAASQSELAATGYQLRSLLAL